MNEHLFPLTVFLRPCCWKAWRWACVIREKICPQHVNRLQFGAFQHRRGSIGRWILQTCSPTPLLCGGAQSVCVCVTHTHTHSSPHGAATQMDHISSWLYFYSPRGTTVWSSNNSENLAAVWISSIVARLRHLASDVGILWDAGTLPKSYDWYSS